MFNFDYWEKINIEIKNQLDQAGKIAPQDEVIEQELHLSDENYASFCDDLSCYKAELSNTKMRKIFWLLLIARARMSKDGTLASLPHDGAFSRINPEWFKTIAEENFKKIKGLSEWSIINQGLDNEPTWITLDNLIEQYDETLRKELDKGSITPKPIICYALDDAFMPEEVYDKWDKFDKKKYIEQSHQDKSAPCGASFLLYWIRKFFNEGNGGNYFEIFTENSDDFRRQILELLKVDVFKYWHNELIPSQGNDLSQWIKSQCWVLSCDKVSERSIKGKNKGETSALRQNNELVYNYVKLMSDYFDNDAEEGVGISIEDLCENAFKAKGKICPDYLKYIWKNHREVYLRSLKALTSSLPKPDEVDGCYATLWGKATGLQDNILTADWELDVNGNYYALCIHYCVGANISSAYLKQGELKLPLDGFDGYISLSTLNKEGFKPCDDITLYADNTDKAHPHIIKGWSLDSPLIFSESKLWRLLYQGQFSDRLYVIASEDAPRVQFNEHEGELQNSVHISGTEWRCYLFQAPETIGRECMLCINGKDALQLKRHPELRLANAANLHLYNERKLNTRKFVVGKEAQLISVYGIGKISVIQDTMAELDHNQNGQYKLFLNDDEFYYQEIKITYTNRIDARTRSMTIIFLPENWQSDCSSCNLVDEIKFAKKGFQMCTLEISGKSSFVISPINEDVWAWKRGKEYFRETLDVYQPNLDLVIYNKSEEDKKLCLIHDTKEYNCYIEYGLARSLDHVIKQFQDCPIQAGDSFQLCIDDCIICEGCYLPEGICWVESPQGEHLLYAHPDERESMKLSAKHETDILSGGDDTCNLNANDFTWNEKHISTLPSVIGEKQGWWILDINEKEKKKIKIGTLNVEERIELNRELWLEQKLQIEFNFKELAAEINSYFTLKDADSLQFAEIEPLFRNSRRWSEYEKGLLEFRKNGLTLSWDEEAVPISGIFHILNKKNKSCPIENIKFQPTQNGKEIWYCKGDETMLKCSFSSGSATPALGLLKANSKPDKIEKLTNTLHSTISVDTAFSQDMLNYFETYARIMLLALKQLQHVGELDIEPEKIKGPGSLVIKLMDELKKHQSPLCPLLMLAVILNATHQGLADKSPLPEEESKILYLCFQQVYAQETLINATLKLSTHLYKLFACFPCK